MIVHRSIPADLPAHGWLALQFRPGDRLELSRHAIKFIYTFWGLPTREQPIIKIGFEDDPTAILVLMDDRPSVKAIMIHADKEWRVDRLRRLDSPPHPDFDRPPIPALKMKGVFA